MRQMCLPVATATPAPFAAAAVTAAGSTAAAAATYGIAHANVLVDRVDATGPRQESPPE